MLSIIQRSFKRLAPASFPLQSLPSWPLIRIAHHLDLRGRLVLLYTCKTFMIVLAEEPLIWNGVRFGLFPLYASGAASVLSRAASYPIRLGLYGRAKHYLGDPDIEALIATHLPRTSSLNISLNGLQTDTEGASLDDALRNIYRTLSGHAPILSLLQLTATMSSRGRQISRSIPLPEDLFGGTIPELRRLVLQGFKLSANIRYHLLHNLTALNYTSSAGTLTQTELESILHQTACLVHLTLQFAGYMPEPQNADTVQGLGEPIMPRYVRLHGFIDGTQAVLRRFAQAPVLAVSFTQQVHLDDFQAWPSAKIRIIALGNEADRCQELRCTHDPAGSPDNCVSVSIGQSLSDVSFIPCERITTLTVSDTHWVTRWHWVSELSQLTELRILLSTCRNRDAKADTLWQVVSEAGRKIPLVPVSSTLNRVTLIANKLPRRTRSGNMTCRSSPAITEAVCTCGGRCCLSLFDVADFLATLLPPHQHLDALDLIGITDIVDVDLEAAFTAVLEFANHIGFAAEDAIWDEEKGFSANAMTREFFPDSDSLREFELTSPFINSWPLFGFD